jgi:hypothetical protein
VPGQVRSWRLAAVLFALFVVAGYDLTQRRALDGRRGFPLDDSWIHLQFARQLARGDGLSYNDGEWVNGSTAPLWTALVSLARGPRWLPLWAKMLGVALFAVAIVLVFQLGLLYGLRPPWAFFTTLLVSLTSWMSWSALSGMEIALFLVLSLGALLLQVKEIRDPSRLPLALPIAAAAYFARPESALLFGVLAAEQWFRAASNPMHRRRVAAGLLGAMLILAPLLATFWLKTGNVLPTTFLVKTGAGPAAPLSKHLLTVVGIFLHPLPWMVLFVGGGIVEILRRRRQAWAPALWLVGLPVCYAWVSRSDSAVVGNFGRYYFPLIPVVCLVGVLGLHRAAEAAARQIRRERVRSLALFALLALVLFPTARNAVRGSRFYARNVVDVERSDGDMARWLAPRLPADAILAVHDVGLVKFMLPNRLIDFAGIITPEVAIRKRQAVGPADPYGENEARRFLEEQKPDYLIFWENWLPRVGRAPGFEILHRIEVPANITMGGPVLTLYSTPWTRFPLRVLEGDLPP